jgi:hypothetical protein
VKGHYGCGALRASYLLPAILIVIQMGNQRRDYMTTGRTRNVFRIVLKIYNHRFTRPAPHCLGAIGTFMFSDFIPDNSAAI